MKLDFILYKPYTYSCLSMIGYTLLVGLGHYYTPLSRDNKINALHFGLQVI